MNTQETADASRYGMLTVLREVIPNRSKNGQKITMLMCRCDCGERKIIRQASLKYGATTSCGCFHKKRSSEANKKHGMHGQKIYSLWGSMLSRCVNKNDKCYDRYGGRGIGVCNSWKDFTLFLKDMGLPPSEKHSIDRIDNDGDYKPENCRWATHIEQANNRRNNQLVEYNGETKTLSQWSRDTGINRSTLEYRFKAGWTIAELFKDGINK